MKLDEVNYKLPGGHEMSGNDIQSMVGDFVKSQKGKGGSVQPSHTDPAVSQYHAQQNHIERQAADDRATSNTRRNIEEEDPEHNRRHTDPHGDRPWRKYAPKLNDPNVDTKNPNHKGPIDFDKWNEYASTMGRSATREDSDQVPEPGDPIRTLKSKMEGKVDRVEGDTVYYRTPDGRLMKTPMANTVVIQKLEDEDIELTEISNALLTKYKSGAAKSASSADAMGDIKTGNKRFSGIVKATNKQFANDAKKNVVANEGGMGGLNRCAPAADVSYEKVLDRNPETAHSKVVGEEQINELSVDKLKAYRDKVGSAKPGHDKVKTLNHVKGYHQAKDKLDVKLGDRTSAARRQGPPASGTYEERLAEFVALDEVDMNQFADLLGKQHQDAQAAAPKRKVVPIDYNGWTIKYRAASKPPKPGEKVDWAVYNHKGLEKHKGVSMSEKDAVADAQEWINQGAGEKRDVTSRATIDFNADFTKQFGSDLYAGITNDKSGPALLVAYEPQEGLKRASSRVTKDRETENTTKTLGIPMSAKECADAGLQANTRYVLGSKDDLGNGLMMFPLIPHSVVQGKGDLHKLGKPGLTVGTERSVDEGISPWGGYDKDDKKAGALAKAPKSTMQGAEGVRLSDMVQDSIREHGVKWAFDYYVKKHGLPPKQFQIFANLVADVPNKPKAAPSWEDPSRATKPKKQSFMQKLRSKLPFEE